MMLAENMTEDELREMRIDAAFLKLQTAQTTEERREAWATIQKEIAQRSPAQVEKMEREKGLI